MKTLGTYRRNSLERGRVRTKTVGLRSAPIEVEFPK